MKKVFKHGGNVFAVARDHGLQASDILDFSASINPLGPAEGVKEALSDAFKDLIHYPDSDCTLLREALANHHGLNSSNICVANGSTELIYLLPRLVRGRRAIIVAPPFSEYARALERDDFQVNYLVLDASNGFHLPMAEVEERLSAGFDICIFGNPGNPTGKLYTFSEVERLFHLCRDAGTLLVVDEAFMDFCEEESAKLFAADIGGILILRSMTKFYAMPGLRLGYVIASESMTGVISALREPWSVNTLAQAAGLASLAAASYGDSTCGVIEKERSYLYRGLSAIPGLKPFPSAANFLLVEVRNNLSSVELAYRLMADHHILVRDCSNFIGLNDRFIRVAVRGREENDRLIKALALAVGER
jgi:threonine-phosphate decarboxylase